MNWDVKEEAKPPAAQEGEPWQLYVARFQSTATINEVPDIPVQVEIQVTGRRTDEQTLSIAEIRRFSLYSTPLDELGGPLSMIGPAEKLNIEPGSTVEGLDFYTNIFYRRLGEFEPGCMEADAVFPQLETLRGTLTWRPEEVRDDGILRVLFSLALHEVIVAVAGDVQSIVFEPEEGVPFYLPDQLPPPEAQGRSLSTCSGGAPAGTAHTLRALNVRFHSVSALQTVAALKTPVQQWIDAACRVWWEKGGIKIVPSPQIDQHTYPAGTPGIILNQSEETAIGTTLGDEDDDRIDVYLADQLSNGHGGGVTHLCGTSDAYILLEIEKARNNKYLLAHELGHVLGLRHPGDPPPQSNALCKSYVEGSFCSVMLPSKPMSCRNTLTNIEVTINTSFPLVAPVFDPITGATDWDPDDDEDIFHFVRDFPYDDGSEDSVPEQPFVDWWTHSGVWNSRSEPQQTGNASEWSEPSQYQNSTPVFNDDHSPKADEPCNSGTNYMCVQLHTCQPLSLPPLPDGSSLPVTVHLYLAVPGSSSQPLRPLGTLVFQDPDPDPDPFAGSSLPLPVHPKTKWLSWTVPSPYPSHCCVFAVAVSSYQPAPPAISDIIGAPASHKFYDLFNLLKTRNDVVQRNLHIQNCTSLSGASLRTMLPWLQVDNPFEHAAAAHVVIDTSRVGEQLALNLEVDGILGPDIENGGMVRVALAEDLATEDRRILRLWATLPADAGPDTIVPIDLRFFVNDELVSCYQHLLRVTPLAETVAQVLDSLVGALRTVHAGCEVDTEELAEQVGLLIPTAAEDAERALGDLCARAALFGSLAEDLESMPQPREQGQAVHHHLKQLADLLSASATAGSRTLLASSVSPILLTEMIRERADRTQEAARRLCTVAGMT